MNKFFNTNAVCTPRYHYMADITDKLKQIKVMVDAGQYFTINRARQYGKTTTLKRLNRNFLNLGIIESRNYIRISYGSFLYAGTNGISPFS